MEQNYGPEGIALWAAAVITVLPGVLMADSGIVFMLASGGGTLLTLGHWLQGFGVILCLLGSIRAFQGIRAGRAFRGSRPFLKPRLTVSPSHQEDARVDVRFCLPPFVRSCSSWGIPPQSRAAGGGDGSNLSAALR